MVLSGSKGSTSSSTNNDTLKKEENIKCYTLAITIGNVTKERSNFRHFREKKTFIVIAHGLIPLSSYGSV